MNDEIVCILSSYTFKFEDNWTSTRGCMFEHTPKHCFPVSIIHIVILWSATHIKGSTLASKLGLGQQYFDIDWSLKVVVRLMFKKYCLAKNITIITSFENADW